jgi:hypothetical protein
MKLSPNRVNPGLKRVLNTWLVDSGATHHFRGQRDWFESFTSLQMPVQAAEATMNATGYGTIQLKLGNRAVTLRDVIYIPQSGNQRHFCRAHNLLESGCGGAECLIERLST